MGTRENKLQSSERNFILGQKFHSAPQDFSPTLLKTKQQAPELSSLHQLSKNLLEVLLKHMILYYSMLSIKTFSNQLVCLGILNLVMFI